MTNQESSEVIIYHYSAVFRDVISDTVTAVGMVPHVFDDPDTALSAINGNEGAVVAVQSEFMPAEDGSLQIVKRGLCLIERANELRTPWNLVVHRTDEPPYELMRKAQGIGEISLIGEPIALSIEERLDGIYSPTKEAQKLFAHSLIGSLQRVLLFKSML